MELISVIVPVYNVEKYLLRCVKSIINQSYTNLEIILVNDGSTDNSFNICEELKKKDDRIKLLTKTNEGLGNARNTGLSVISGEYVTFIDSDDWISKNHIENLYLAMVKTESDMVIGSHTTVGVDGVETEHKVSLSEIVYQKEEILNDILLPLIGPDLDYPKDVQVESSCCMNLYRTNIIKNNQISFVSERYAVAEDLYFNIDFLSFAQRVAVINENGYYYFQNAESISRKYNPKRVERTLNYYKLLYDLTEKYGLCDCIKFRIERSFLMKIRVAIRHIISSDMKRKDKFHEIKMILKNPIVNNSLKRYPIKTYSLLMRILSYFMLTKNVLGVYYMIKFRESIRKR